MKCPKRQFPSAQSLCYHMVGFGASSNAQKPLSENWSKDGDLVA
jgi:hypothetical protein